MRHSLLVPDGVSPDDVEALASSWYPGQVGRAPGRLTLPNGAVLLGPGPVPDGGARLGWTGAAYEIEVTPERGEPVPAALLGRRDLLDAFAEGEPLGVEREALELALAIARRVGGAVRTAGATPSTLTPAGLADLLLYSAVWLHPDALLHVLEPLVPGIALPGEVERTPLPDDAAIGLRSLIDDEGTRRWWHAEADAYDAHMATEAEVTESYGAVAPQADGAVLSVTVEAAVGVPPALAGHDWTGVICYEVRCSPAEPRSPQPPEATETIDAVTRALLGTIGGAVVDDDGFLVDLTPNPR